jgi:calcineurin-like phosphoesterase family protein
MRKIYATSDEHYFHAKLLGLQNRPFKTVEEMNEAILEGHNSIVKPEDEVWHLGDFFLGVGTEFHKIWPILHKLNGKHHLIRGNHDTDAKVSFLHKDFASIQHYAEISVCKTKVVMSHFPMLRWHHSDKGSVMLHGHCHGHLLYPFKAKIMDVGVDPNGFKPVLIEQVVQEMKDRPALNHHYDRM